MFLILNTHTAKTVSYKAYICIVIILDIMYVTFYVSLKVSQLLPLNRKINKEYCFVMGPFYVEPRISLN